MYTRLHTGLIAGAALAFLLTGRPAAAQISGTTTVVDQSYDPATNAGANINEGFRYIAQSYTAGVTGTLSGVSVDIFGSGNGTAPLEILIVGTTDGVPNSTVLGQTLLNSTYSSFSQVVTFDDVIGQVAGSSYAIVATYPDAPPPGAGQYQGIWDATTTPPYDGGELFQGESLDTFAPVPIVDAHFQTLVTPAPEPSSLAALLVGALGLGGLTLRARKRCL